jgi:enoyl-CoA hydratase
VEGIYFHVDSHIGFITLDRPKALNALSREMIIGALEHLSEWQYDDNVHAIVIQSALEKIFCVGGDVRYLYNHRDNAAFIDGFFTQEYALNLLTSTIDKPYIAILDGLTMGGGVGISIHGGYAVATEHFGFAMPETAIGLFPDVGVSYLLAHRHFTLGMYLALTGRKLGVRDAVHWKYIPYAVHHADIPKIMNDMKMLDLRQQAHEKIRAHFEAYAFIPEGAGLSAGEMQIIDACFTLDSVEAIINALSNMQDDFAQDIVRELHTKSPMSLVLTHQQLHMVRHYHSLKQCLDLDTKLVRYCMRQPDFFEGVRALLIDKDKMPKWQPADLGQVNLEII